MIPRNIEQVQNVLLKPLLSSWNRFFAANVTDTGYAGVRLNQHSTPEYGAADGRTDPADLSVWGGSGGGVYFKNDNVTVLKMIVRE